MRSVLLLDTVEHVAGHNMDMPGLRVHRRRGLGCNFNYFVKQRFWNRLLLVVMNASPFECKLLKFHGRSYVGVCLDLELRFRRLRTGALRRRHRFLHCQGVHPCTTMGLRPRSKVTLMHVSYLRYPVKSMIGEQIDTIDVTGTGAWRSHWATATLNVAESVERRRSHFLAMRISTPRRRPC